MAKLSGTKWNLDRDLGAPEDEFFGLLEEDELPGEEPLAPGREAKKPFFQKIIGALISKEPKDSEEERLEDVIIDETPAPRPAQGGDLEEYIIRLPAGREWDEFLQAEQEASLFDSIQETRRKRIRSSTWALWISAAIWLYLGLTGGVDYLSALTDSGISGGAWLTDQFGAQAGQAITVTLGVIAPVIGFLLTASSLALIIGGVYERRPMRAIIGLGGLIMALLTLKLMGGAYYQAAVIVGILSWLVLRAVEWLLVRIGAY